MSLFKNQLLRIDCKGKDLVPRVEAQTNVWTNGLGHTLIETPDKKVLLSVEWSLTPDGISVSISAQE